jgi:hypothetical protein
MNFELEVKARYFSLLRQVQKKRILFLSFVTVASNAKSGFVSVLGFITYIDRQKKKVFKKNVISLQIGLIGDGTKKERRISQ